MLTVKPWKKLSVCVSIDIFQLLLTVVPEFVIHDFWQPEQKHTSTELQELDRIHAQSRVEIEGWGWEGSWGREGEGPGARGRRTGPMKIGGGNPDYLTGHPLAQQPHNTTILTHNARCIGITTPPLSHKCRGQGKAARSTRTRRPNTHQYIQSHHSSTTLPNT